MIKTSQSTLTEALAVWGEHEARGRLKGKVQIDLNNRFACADLALRYRAPFVRRILEREPMATFDAVIDASDVPSILLADGKTVDSWIQVNSLSKGDSWTYFRQMVDADDPPLGPIFCTATISRSQSTYDGPLFVYDGWHRISAWAERVKIGKRSTITAFLVQTRK
jgi:hypothetical protein